MDKRNYVLRHVIGKYFLICNNQRGKEYIPPIELNEVGACIWKRYQMGESSQQISQYMAEEYGISIEEANTDVTEFLERLGRHGCISDRS